MIIAPLLGSGPSWRRRSSVEVRDDLVQGGFESGGDVGDQTEKRDGCRMAEIMDL